MTEYQLIDKRRRYETSHILHLLLCIPSAGLWIIPWAIISLSNAIERGKIDRKLNALK